MALGGHPSDYNRLSPLVAKGYLTKLLPSEAVNSYVQRDKPEILEQFELVANPVRMG